jgi:hypothetical protein
MRHYSHSGLSRMVHAVAAVVLAVGCGNNSSQGGSAGSGTEADGGMGGRSAAGGNNADGGNGASAAIGSGGRDNAGTATAGSAATRHGSVTIADLLSPLPEKVIAAEFIASEVDPGCTLRNFGDCVVQLNCAKSAPATVYASAGVVSATCAAPAINVQIQPDSDNAYASQPFSSALGGGETLHVAVSGGTVAAFATDITVPLVLLVNSPATDSGGTILASSANDLKLAFSRGVAGTDLVAEGSTQDVSISCMVNSTLGVLTIPAAAIGAIGAGASISLYTFATVSVTAGDWNVDVQSVMNAYTPDHKEAVQIQVQ